MASVSKSCTRKRKYDIAAAEYDILLLTQDVRCAICKRLHYTKKGLVVDHCHQRSDQGHIVLALQFCFGFVG